MQTKDTNNELKNICFTQKLLEKSSIIQFIWKNEKYWPVKYVSNNVKNILGYSSNDFTSGKILYANIIHPTDLNQITNEIKKYSKLKQDLFEHKSYRLIAKNGKTVWIKNITHINRDANNNIKHFESIIIDITQQKESEDALKISKNYYKAIMKNSGDAISVIDKKEKSIFRSASYEKSLGFTTKEKLGKNQERSIKESEEIYKNIIENLTDVYYRADKDGLITMVSPSAIEIFKADTIDDIIGLPIKNIYQNKRDRTNFISRIKKYGEVKNFKTILYRKDNTEIYVETTAKILLNEKKEYIGVEGIVRDISERNESEIALRKSKEKYETVAKYTYDWEYWIDADNNFVYVSPSSERITGYTPEEFYKNKNLIFDIIHPNDKNILLTHKNAYIKKGNRTSIEFRIITKDKKTEWIGHVSQNVFDENGKYLGVRGNNRLITKRKLAEKKLKKNELKLKEINAAKDKFFSIIAHDLRGPFNSMFGFSELLMTNYDKYDTKKQKKYLSIIFDGIRNTYKLLDDLLLWSRSQQGTINFNPEPLTLFIVTDDICSILEQSAKTKSIKIVNNIPENIIVFADVDILSTIIRNLISNSIKFTKNGGRVEINANYNPKTHNQKFVQVSVKDNGVGMSKEKQLKLFDIKKNVSTYGTEDEAGTGLGLILCKEFVKKHKGKIWLESEKNVGTTFYFTIPTSK